MAIEGFYSKLKRSLAENSQGIAAAAVAAIATAIITTASSGMALVPAVVPTGNDPAPVSTLREHLPRSARLTTSLTQSKFVQGASGLASVEINIETPATVAVDRKPTDFVVVLDRSGSMSADNRLPYAKSAILELIDRLQEGDRMGLITFDSAVDVKIPLAAVSDGFKSSSRKIVDAIVVGGSTNIGEALGQASTLLPRPEAGRVRKVLLLSDGEANVGIVQPEALGTLAHSLTEKSAVLSTIGIGLGFNERTMSLMADRGMGNYAYLESLEKLGTILAKDIDSTRAIYAQASRIDLVLPNGASIVDSGGYPYSAISAVSNGYRIETGQLLGGSRKSFFVTVNLPTSTIGERSFAAANLLFDIDGNTNQVSADGPLMLASIVPQERAVETAASINQEVYRRSWVQNSLGMMKAKVSKLVAEGRRDEADKTIADYHGQVKEAERQSNLPLLNEGLAREIDAVKADASEAFSGGAAEQQLKQNRFGKKYHMQARSEQRAN
jgi:Ca-activated chloride channel family protein